MTDVSITLEPATDGRIDRVESMLDANDLPTEDVRENPECFFVATTDTCIVGTGGVERAGPDGLLRSVVVTEPNQGRGYGTALCRALEDHARTTGIPDLYLLTTTAADFFRQLGYETLDRGHVPPNIRRTHEFTDLCPKSATCMHKHL